MLATYVFNTRVDKRLAELTVIIDQCDLIVTHQPGLSVSIPNPPSYVLSSDIEEKYPVGI